MVRSISGFFCSSYHLFVSGLTLNFVLNDEHPLYNGPISTSSSKSTALSFAKGTGQIWTIQSSFRNPFKFAIGISVDWISFHSEEREVLLINQYIPIQSVKSFEFLLKNIVIHLLHSVISYKKPITDPLRFYKVMGIAGQFGRDVPYDPDWIPLIEEMQLEKQILCERLPSRTRCGSDSSKS